MALTAKHRTRDGEPENLNFSVNPASKKLLDVLVSILADDYIRIAKENPEIFSAPVVNRGAEDKN